MQDVSSLIALWHYKITLSFNQLSRHYDSKFTMARSLRADPGPAASGPDRVRFPPSPKRDARLDLPDPQDVLSQWRLLEPQDPKIDGYDELLGTLVDVEDNRKATMKLTDNDAGTVINIIGEVSFCDILNRTSTTSYT